MRIFEACAGLVLLGCAGLLGEVGWSIASQAPMPVLMESGQDGPGDVGSEPMAGVVAIRDLRRHLPLAGMPDAPPMDPDACRRLEGYVVDAVHDLRELGKKPPFAPELLKTALDSGRCGVDAPEVKEILQHLGRAYGQAGLDVVLPMYTSE
jgi:hypothetical protein